MSDNDNNPTDEELSAIDAAEAAAAEEAAAADAARVDALSAALSGEGAEQGADESARIQELEAQIAEMRDHLLRALAETENIRKRGERQLEDAHKFAITAFARDILSVADNLERAVAAVPEERRGEHELLGVLLDGVRAVQSSFAQAMTSNKVVRIEPVGEPFDPNLHEAIFEVPGTDLPNGTVAQVVEPGYTLHDRLLRPARVGVAKSASGPAASGDESGDPKVDTTV